MEKPLRVAPPAPARRSSAAVTCPWVRCDGRALYPRGPRQPQADHDATQTRPRRGLFHHAHGYRVRGEAETLPESEQDMSGRPAPRGAGCRTMATPKRPPPARRRADGAVEPRIPVGSGGMLSRQVGPRLTRPAVPQRLTLCLRSQLVFVRVELTFSGSHLPLAV